MAQTQLAQQRYSDLAMRKRAIERLLKRSLSAEAKQGLQTKLAHIETRLATPGMSEQHTAATEAQQREAAAGARRATSAGETRSVLEQRYGENWRKRLAPEYKPGKNVAAYKLSQQQSRSSEQLKSLRTQERQLGGTDAALRARLEKRIGALVERRTARAGKVAKARTYIQGFRKSRQRAIQGMPGNWLQPGAKIPRAKPKRKRK